MRACDFLAEDYSVLLEYDRSKTAAAYGEKLLAAALKDTWFVQQFNNALPGGNINDTAKKNPERVLDYLLTWIERGDPTQHKEYSQSIAKLYANGQSKLEDVASTLADYLTKFDKLKRRKKIQPPRNDFNRYRSLEDFYDVVDEYPDEEVDAPKEEKKNATELYRDDKLIVLVPNDMEAACYYGQGTRWCTAGKNNNMYNYYTKGNKPLYIIIPRQPAYPGEKYQFHFESNQFKNEQDHEIGRDGMEKLIARFPVLTKVLQQPAEKFSVTPLIGDEYKEIVRNSTPEVVNEMNAIVEKYKDRIVAFGFKSIEEYGVKLPEAAQQEVSGAVAEYITTVMNNLEPVYEKLLAQPGKETKESVIEETITTDPLLNEIARKSPANKMILKTIQATGKKITPNAATHLTDLLLREPLARFLMKQIPKLYKAQLQEKGHALD